MIKINDSQYDSVLLLIRSTFINKPSSRACNTRTDSCITELFMDEVIKSMLKFLGGYVPLEDTDDKFDTSKDIAGKFCRSEYYNYCFMNANRLYKTKYSREISYDSLDMELPARGEQMEDKVERVDLEERAMKSFNRFATLLNDLERAIFKGMRAGVNTREIHRQVSLINPGLTEKVIRIIRKEIEFRLSCHLLNSKQQIYSTAIILAGMNTKFGKLVKRFFNVDRLTDIPSDEELHFVASGKFKKKGKVDAKRKFSPMALVVEPPSKFVKASNTDFNGKKHDHPVVYFLANGNSYCHITKTWKNATTF